MSEGERKRGGGGSWLVAVVAGLLIAGGGGTYYFYNQYQASQQELKQAKVVAEEAGGQANVVSLVEEVGRLMELPTDETPTVALIKDIEKLKDHPFLSKGQAGDRLLIYTGPSKLVVMYRPETKKIVAVGTVTIQQSKETPVASPVGQP